MIDTNSTTWKIIERTAKKRIESLTVSLVNGTKTDDILRGRIRELELLLEMPHKKDIALTESTRY